MIDIIIPAYNSHKTIEQTLFSIAIQENVNEVKVYIVNDCSERDYRNEVIFFSKFMDITELKLKENKGPGYARQYGLTHSNSEYVVFIDSDDTLYDCYSLNLLKNAIEKDNSDLVISDFWEETDTSLINHSDETIYVHGKMYRRSFIENNNIGFNDSRHDEDNGFNQLLLFHLPKISFLRERTFVWRNNKESITRKGAENFSSFGLSGYIYNIKWAIEEGIKRNCDPTRMSELGFTTLLSVYYYYLYLKEEQIIPMLKPLYDVYIKNPIPESSRQRLTEEQFNYSSRMCPKELMINPTITFDEFIDKVIEVGEVK